MYSRASYIYLDDVLSAVDVHTAQHIVDQCLLGSIAASRTLIMVTHHASMCAPKADTIVHLERGRSVFVGNSASYIGTDLYTSLQSNGSVDGSIDTNPISGKTAPAPKDSPTKMTIKPLVDSTGGPVKPHTMRLEKRVSPIGYNYWYNSRLLPLQGEGSAGYEVWLFWARGNGRLFFWSAALVSLVAYKAVWMVRDATVGYVCFYLTLWKHLQLRPCIANGRMN